MNRTFLLLLIALSLLLFSCGKKQEAILKVGIAPYNPPFCYSVDENFVGLDVDIAYEIAGKLEIPIVFVELDNENLLSELALGKLDLAISAIAKKELSDDLIYFSRPYYSVDREDGTLKEYVLGLPKGGKLNGKIEAALDDLIAGGTVASLIQIHIQ